MEIAGAREGFRAGAERQDEALRLDRADRSFNAGQTPARPAPACNRRAQANLDIAVPLQPREKLRAKVAAIDDLFGRRKDAAD